MEVLSTVLQKEAQVLELAYPSVIGFQTKFIGNWTVLHIMSGNLYQLGLTQNNCSLNSFSDIKFIGNWTVLQIMSGDLGYQLGLTQNNYTFNSEVSQQ